MTAQDQLTWARDVFKLTLGICAEAGARISTWLVIGNAGALAIALGALLNGTTCEGDLVYVAALRFSAGLALAFAAAIIGWIGGHLMLGKIRILLELLSGMAAAKLAMADLEARGIQTKEGDPLHRMYDTAQQQALKQGFAAAQALAVAAGVLLLLSAGAFGAGIAVPLLAPNGAFTSCIKSSDAALQSPAGKAS